MEIRKLFLVAAISFVFVGCNEDKKTEIVKPTVVSGIVRVLMHNLGSYTFLVKQADKKIGQLSIHANVQRVHLVEDLTDKEPMRIEIVCGWWNSDRDNQYTCKPIPQTFSYWSISANQLVIHLHSVRQIDGAGWNHGKFGRGTTIVVE